MWRRGRPLLLVFLPGHLFPDDLRLAFHVVEAVDQRHGLVVFEILPDDLGAPLLRNGDGIVDPSDPVLDRGVALEFGLLSRHSLYRVDVHANPNPPHQNGYTAPAVLAALYSVASARLPPQPPARIFCYTWGTQGISARMGKKGGRK